MDPAHGPYADEDAYDAEAYIGTEEGDMGDGKVLDDLDEEDEQDFDDDDDDDDDGEAEGYGARGDEEGAGGGSAPEAASAEAGAAGAGPPAARRLPSAAMARLDTHKDAVVAAAWLRPGVALTGSMDETAVVWHVNTPGPEGALCLRGHTDTVAAVAADASGEAVATGGMDATVRVWHAGDGGAACTLEGPGAAIEWLQWHPKGHVILGGSADMTAWMWNVAEQRCMQVFAGHSGPVTAGGFTPNGRTVVTAGGEGDGSVRVWDPRTGEATAVVAPGHNGHDAEGGVTSMAFAPDSGAVATGGADGVVVVTSLATGRAVARLAGTHEDGIEDIEYAAAAGAPEGAHVLTGGLDGRVVAWDVQAAAPRAVRDAGSPVVTLSAQHAGPLFAVGCTDGAVVVLDARSAAHVREYCDHTAAVQRVAWAPDDLHIVSGSDDCTACVFSIM